MTSLVGFQVGDLCNHGDEVRSVGPAKAERRLVVYLMFLENTIYDDPTYYFSLVDAMFITTHILD